MNQKQAIELLKGLINGIENLRESHAFSEEHTSWFIDTQNILEDVFGGGSRIYQNFSNMNWSFTGTFVASADEYETIKQIKDQEQYQRALDASKGLLKAGIDLIARKGIENIYTPKESDKIVKIISLINGKLRKLIRAKPKKEKEINDALEHLFIAAGLDRAFAREKIKIPYSSKSYIPDFVFDSISTIVEAKLCDSKKRQKEIISEINDDILAYKTKSANLIFVIYDLGIIRDQDQFKESIETQDNVILKIIKH